MSKQKELSRRDFIKGAAAGAAMVAAGAALPAPVLAAPGVPEKWDKEADVVVVGYGGAGAAATLEARKAGAKVLVLERQKQGGGSSAICGGYIYMGGGTPLQKALKIEDSRDEMFKYVLAASGDGADPEFVGLLCDSSLDLYNWLSGLGLTWKQSFYPQKNGVPPTDDGLAYSGSEDSGRYSAIAKPAPRGHHSPAPLLSGPVMFKPIAAAVAASGADIMYETPVKQLVVDKNGRVVGVVATVAGQDKYFKANKGVVLTAGGFAGNKAMLGLHAPALLRAGPVIGTAGDDGAGIRLGQSVGADVRGIGNVFADCNVYSIDEALCKGILVDERGMRFTPEDVYGATTGDLIVRDHPITYLVFDEGVMAQVPEAKRKDLALNTKAGTDPAQVSLGNAVVTVAKADSIAELATKLKIPVTALESTIALYNTMAANGEDLVHNKAKKWLQPLKTPPFYARTNSAANHAIFTMGGLRINTNTQVLDTAGKPIPGLYSAGRNATMVCARFYAGSGISMAEVLTFGRIAGKNVAAEKPAA